MVADETAVIVPCLNEARHIATAISGALRQVRRVIVIDDGSTDATAKVAAETGALVLRHERPKGKGAALQTGFTAALADGFEWAIAMDGDGQHLPEDIPQFLHEAENTNGRMIVGNRMTNPDAMPRLRRWVNQWMSRRLSEFCGVPVPDSQCGFRMLHLNSWKELPVRAEHFEIESELLVRFAAAGLAIRSIPIQTRYAGEQSKIRPLRDTARWIKWWLRSQKELGKANAVWPRTALSHDGGS